MTVLQNICLNKSQHMDGVLHRKSSLKIREALEEVVSGAFEQQRLVQGILETTAVLNGHPKDVMFVVLEQAEEDKWESEIHEKLIQAYCTEKCVKCIKVTKCSTLLQTIKRNTSTHIVSTEAIGTDENCSERLHTNDENSTQAIGTDELSLERLHTKQDKHTSSASCEPKQEYSKEAISTKEENGSNYSHTKQIDSMKAIRTNRHKSDCFDQSNYSCPNESVCSQPEENQYDPVQCLLIRNPQTPSEADRFLTAFYDTLVDNNIIKCPYIRV